jgi:hypothetical protein
MATPFGLISLACLLHSLDHILNNFLRITKDHHGFIQIEELIIKDSKNKDLEQYKKEQEKLNLLG